jgi:hypothetical protein
MLPVLSRNWQTALKSILSQCWGGDAHGCNCSAKDQLCDICHDLARLPSGEQDDDFIIDAQKVGFLAANSSTLMQGSIVPLHDSASSCFFPWRRACWLSVSHDPAYRAAISILPRSELVADLPRRHNARGEMITSACLMA